MTNARLRSATQEDGEFIFSSYKLLLRAHVEWAWGWNEEAQLSGFWKNLPLKEFQLVLVDQKRAGALFVEEQETLHFLRMIFLLPEFQNQGIGSQLVEAEVARARALSKPLHLKVIKANPAWKLYERLGFVVCGEGNATYHMRVV